MKNFWGAEQIPGIGNVCGAFSWHFLLESSVSHPGKWQLHLSTHSPVPHQRHRLCPTDHLPQARPFPAKGHPHHNTHPGHTWCHLQNLFHSTTNPAIRMSFAYPHLPLQLAQRTHGGIWSPPLSSHPHILHGLCISSNLWWKHHRTDSRRTLRHKGMSVFTPLHMDFALWENESKCQSTSAPYNISWVGEFVPQRTSAGLLRRVLCVCQT